MQDSVTEGDGDYKQDCLPLDYQSNLIYLCKNI